MNCKWLLFLTIALILGFSSPTDARILIRPRPPPRGPPLKGMNCNVAPSKRINCGYPGITEEPCLIRGCCFRDEPRKAIKCFFPKQLQQNGNWNQE